MTNHAAARQLAEEQSTSSSDSSTIELPRRSQSGKPNWPKSQEIETSFSNSATTATDGLISYEKHGEVPQLFPVLAAVDKEGTSSMKLPQEAAHQKSFHPVNSSSRSLAPVKSLPSNIPTPLPKPSKSMPKSLQPPRKEKSTGEKQESTAPLRPDALASEEKGTKDDIKGSNTLDAVDKMEHA